MLTLLQSRPAAAGGAGVSDHGLLSGLGDDDHAQYALLAGRSGGQLFNGGLAASEHLTLQSTAHATRGYIRAQDDVQLLSNILRDAAGTNRIQLAAASPHLLFTGNLKLSGVLGLKGTTPDAAVGLKLTSAVTGAFTGLDVSPAISLNASGLMSYGLAGIATASAVGAYTDLFVYGLNFSARARILNQTATFAELTAAQIQTGYIAQTSGGLTVAQSRGLYVTQPFVLKSGTTTMVITDHRQIDVDNACLSYALTQCGLRVADQSGASIANWIAWFGGATPQVRIDGGAYAVANKTGMVLGVNGTLYRVIRNAGTGALETEAA